MGAAKLPSSSSFFEVAGFSLPKILLVSAICNTCELANHLKLINVNADDLDKLISTSVQIRPANSPMACGILSTIDLSNQLPECCYLFQILFAISVATAFIVVYQ